MIDIFVPEKIGSYYLLPKRILGFDIANTYVYCSQLYLKGATVQIEKFFHEKIDTNNAKPYEERVAEAIKTIMKQANAFDSIKTSLSSALITFKELQLPFADPEQLSLIVKYEIEPSLPFAITDTIIDFIITDIHPETKLTSILVAAVQKKDIAEHLRYFHAAALDPDSITIDFFDLYGLYRELPTYGQKKETIALVDIDFNVTSIAFIIEGQLKLIRTLPKGIFSLAKNMGQARTISSSQSLEDIIRFGFEKHNDGIYRQAIEQAWGPLFNEIQFTLQSFLTQTKTEHSIDRIILLGSGATIHGIDNFAKNLLSLPVNIFDTNAILKIPSIGLNHALSLPITNLISFSTAFPSTLMNRFNLRQEEFAVSTIFTFYKQFFTMIGLIIALLGLLVIHNFWQKRTLTKTIYKMEHTVIDKLRSSDLSDAKTFDRALNDAIEKVAKEEELWFSFSQQRRFSFLKLLEDLSIAIDRESIGLNLKKLIITSNNITLEGSIKGFEELKLLERELKESSLFTHVPTLQELKFSETLPLKKKGN